MVNTQEYIINYSSAAGSPEPGRTPRIRNVPDNGLRQEAKEKQ